MLIMIVSKTSEYTRKKGVILKRELPIRVDENSVDTWVLSKSVAHEHLQIILTKIDNIEVSLLFAKSVSFKWTGRFLSPDCRSIQECILLITQF